ncbi:MAG TPA: HD domain-containing phosphohydrolase [Miltoncostaea sp.]|nr:HD domain-containing phosphohydrolase [Miltoncostaea sp.]
MQELPRGYRRYAAALAVAGVVVVAALAFVETPTVDPALVAVVLTGLLCLHPRVVQSSERSAISLNHLPILAAVLVCPPVVAPALGGLLAAIDNRAYGRYVVASNGGGVALAAAAAVGTAHAAWALGLPSDAGQAGWFFGAAAAAAAFFAANHLLVSGMIALKYGEAPLAVWRRCLKPMVGADLIGSTILIAFVNLVQGVDGAAVKAAAAGIGAVAVGMLLVVITRTRQIAEALAEREEAVADREAAVAAREEALAESARARNLAQAARGRLMDVAAGTVPGLVGLVDLRDRYTARHSAAVGRLCRLLAAELGWSAEDVALAHLTGLVHDIGKVGLPDEVLRTAGRPTPEQWDLIHQHAGWGADILGHMRLMPAAVDGVRSHHERWDGSGYPMGLRGLEIPPLGRLVAICDSYDAMTGSRPFRARKPGHVARQELAVEAGILYDPHMTEALLAVLETIDEVEELLHPSDFAEEWRRACAEIDVELLYRRASADLEGGATPVIG